LVGNGSVWWVEIFKSFHQRAQYFQHLRRLRGHVLGNGPTIAIEPAIATLGSESGISWPPQLEGEMRTSLEFAISRDGGKMTGEELP
jgi:hypothetical protein